MNELPMPQGVDPAIWRGLTQARISRRSALGTGLALGLTALLAESAGAASSVGSSSWWAGQKLHRVVNFANWPLYIDVLAGRHPSLDHFTKVTGIKVNYYEAVQDNASFYAKIRPSLAAGQYTGYDIGVLTSNNPELGYVLQNKWAIPLDHALMPNFTKYAGPLVKNPVWDPGNKYTMAWQSGWTSIAYNKKTVTNPGDSVQILFNKKYKGRIGMLSDPFELGAVGLLAIGVEPAKSTESDWSKAAKLLRQQRSDGLVAAYYDQSYIQHLKNGDVDVTQAYSGDIFQANLNSKYQNLVLMLPQEGLMQWTDNMVILAKAQNPVDAMKLMDYFYDPMTQAVIEYTDDYICPVPAARQQLMNPTGWDRTALAQAKKVAQLPYSVTANSQLVFPSGQTAALTKSYYPFKSQVEIDTWNSLFLPIVQGA
jgi:spermidine/putrescine transport system substrate-binding protein